MRRISIFGSTGSIGQTALQILAQIPNSFKVEVITAQSNAILLAKQARKIQASRVVVENKKHYKLLKETLFGSGIKVCAGGDALHDSACTQVDVCLSAVVGFAGVRISLLAAKNCRILALANKESLVCSGTLLRKICHDNNTNLLPVDSEHSAIFQCINGEPMDNIERIILTASGGPFRKLNRHDMKKITPAQARLHPNWKMGQRISIDSASMFNKAMEVIEAKELFDFDPDRIEVVIHPQSIVHSIVGFVDGSMLAQMGAPDMAYAISYAINWPKRAILDTPRLNFIDLKRLEFEALDNMVFPAVALARQAIRLGQYGGTIFNAAKEQALDLFLAVKIDFLDMARLVENTLNNIKIEPTDCLDDFETLYLIDWQTRRFVRNLIK